MPRLSRQIQIGILSGLLLATALGVKLFGPADYAPTTEVFGACMRIGIILAVLCLAYKDLTRLPRWTAPTFVILLLAVLYRAAWLLSAIPPVIAVSWLLRPRGARR